MKNIIPLLNGFAALPVYAQQLNKWTNANGRVHYSERQPDVGSAKEQPAPPSAKPAASMAEDLHQRELDSRERRMQREAANQEAADAVGREKYNANLHRRH